MQFGEMSSINHRNATNMRSILWFISVILNDKDREQNHAQSKDIQLDTVQNSTIDVAASAADLLLALFGKSPKQIKQKPVIDAKQVLSETGFLPMAACRLQEV